MRAFWISLVLLAAMLVLITVSTVYGRHVCNELQRMTQALPDEPGEQSAVGAEELRSYWQDRTPWLRPIINRTIVRTMSDLLGDLSVFAGERDNVADYRATQEKLLGAIDEMRRGEKATFGLWS